MIGNIESRRAEFKRAVWRHGKAFIHRKIVVLISGIAQGCMSAGCVADGEIRRLVESRWIKPQRRTRIAHVRIHPRRYIYI